MQRLFVCINGLFILIWFFFFFIFQFYSYPQFADYISFLLKIENNKSVFLTLFTQNIHLKLKWITLSLLVFQIAVLVVGLKRQNLLLKLKYFIQSASQYPQWLFNSFKNLNRTEKGVLILFLGILIFQRLWLSHLTSVIYDEAWTYLAFTSKNPLVALCLYPSSNNHILFSHLTQITKYLPFDILTNLRLAALIPNILACITLFFCIRKYVKPLIAWCAVILFSFSFPMVYYGFVARGYSLLVLFFIIGFFSVISIIENSENRKAWYRLVVSSVLGLYTIPVYLYPFLGLVTFLFFYALVLKNKKFIIKTIVNGLVTCIFTFIIYIPIFVVSGMSSVTNNKFVASLDFYQVVSGFLIHLKLTLNFLTAIQNMFVIGLIAIFFIILIFKKVKWSTAIYLSVFILTVAPVFIFIHKVIPVERTWIYLLIPIIFLIAISINSMKLTIIGVGLSLSYAIFIQGNWTKQMHWYDRICEEDYNEGKYFTGYFQSKKATIVTSSRMNSYLKFNAILQNQNWKIVTRMESAASPNTFLIKYIENEKLKNRSPDIIRIATYGKYELYQLK